MKLNALMTTGLAAALALTLAACGGGGDSAASDVPTLRRGISAKVDTLDLSLIHI